MFTTTDNLPPVRYALFDFDGTISTLRQGWEDVMLPLMLEFIAGPQAVSSRLEEKVRSYIDRSTGIQTIEQMIWLVDTAAKEMLNPHPPRDPWECKSVYTQRLHTYIKDRRKNLQEGVRAAEQFMVAGSRLWLEFLCGNEIELYLASGTDEEDVRYEAGLLQVDHFFREIAGARPYITDCAKEKVIRMLLDEHNVPPAELVIFGDGPVEISIGKQIGARTVGLASDEKLRAGIDPRKKSRLEKAGADIIIGDFQSSSLANLPQWLGLQPAKE